MLPKPLIGLIALRFVIHAALVFLGLSFAGWNVVGSLLLMVLSLQAAFAASAQRLKG